MALIYQSLRELGLVSSRAKNRVLLQSFLVEAALARLGERMAADRAGAGRR